MAPHSARDCSTQHAHSRTSPEENTTSGQESRKSIDSKSKESENEQRLHDPFPTTQPARTCLRAKVVPLSGNPYFTSIVGSSQVQKPFQLVFPKDFYKHLPYFSAPMVLSCGNKRWEMQYSGDHSRKRICGGFRDFAIDTGLELGDACVYELMSREKMEFRVHVLSGKIPSEFANGASSGMSSDSVDIID